MYFLMEYDNYDAKYNILLCLAVKSYLLHVIVTYSLNKFISSSSFLLLFSLPLLIMVNL